MCVNCREYAFALELSRYRLKSIQIVSSSLSSSSSVDKTDDLTKGKSEYLCWVIEFETPEKFYWNAIIETP